MQGGAGSYARCSWHLLASRCDSGHFETLFAVIWSARVILHVFDWMSCLVSSWAGSLLNDVFAMFKRCWVAMIVRLRLWNVRRVRTRECDCLSVLTRCNARHTATILAQAIFCSDVVLFARTTRQIVVRVYGPQGMVLHRDPVWTASACGTLAHTSTTQRIVVGFSLAISYQELEVNATSDVSTQNPDEAAAAARTRVERLDNAVAARDRVRRSKELPE